MRHLMLNCLVLPVLVALLPSAWSAAPLSGLTFEERVDAQRDLEEVYWRHRIWPEDNPFARPAFEVALPDSVLRVRVEDYLRKSAALEELWKRPVSVNGLQDELERMARTTRRPEMLRELFAALGNDPLRIAECLVRPLLVDRLIREYYAADERFHGDLRVRAQAELARVRGVADLRRTTGHYVETTWVRAAEPSAREPAPERTILLGTEHAWREALARTHAMVASKSAAPFDPSTPLVVGVVGPLQNAADSVQVLAVLRQDEDRFVTASVSWPRTSFDAWWDEGRAGFAPLPPPVGDEFVLPAISGAPCSDDTWSATLSGAADPRFNHTAIWTGSEMIVWGGQDWTGEKGTGGRYRPSTDTWSPMSNTNSPSKRYLHTAVWTGQEMIVWGGFAGVRFNDGGHYNPSTDTWAPTGGGSMLPSARQSHSAVWGGGRMIIWGGLNQSSSLNSGATYNPFNPGSFRWSTMSTVNAPTARAGHSAVWAGTGVSGTEMVVWGGFSGSTLYSTGGRYNVAANTWSPTSNVGAPAARRDQTAIWSGTELIVWGGFDGTNHLNSGGRYDPSGDTWSATSTGANVPGPRSHHSAVWVTGTEMIVWGGFGPGGYQQTGGRYDPGTDSWTATGVGANVPSPREKHTAVWTSFGMIVWGGISSANPMNTGGIYDPLTDAWVPTATGNVPRPRSSHTSVWTGSEMIVYGGWDGTSYALPGRSYDPATNTWSGNIGGMPTRSDHVAVWTGSEMIVYGGTQGGATFLASGLRYNPTSSTWAAIAVHTPARVGHSAIWTGREMVVWGGRDFLFNRYNTGGRYDPVNDLWTYTSQGAGVPSTRYDHTAVWTGREMIVWGGRAPGRSNTGARYDSVADTWTATGSGAGVPAARYDHSAVWAGDEMIVWGGNITGLTNTGGRYDPNTDGWTATSTGAGVPAARSLHSAVWTREEMIVWGGLSNTGGRYDPAGDSWTATSLLDAASSRSDHTALWAGGEMIVWGGTPLNSVGARYCACASVTPATTPVLVASQPSSGTLRLAWAALPGATSYDVVSGKLSTLRAGGAGFSQAVDRCLVNSQSTTQVDDSVTPAPGDSFWYLGRGANCAGVGSYDSAGFWQSSPRDSSIAASGLGCP